MQATIRVSTVKALWQQVRNALEGTSPKIVDAVHHCVNLVRAAPVGTDVLGIYWGAFGFEGKRQDAVAELEEASAQRNIAKLQAGCSAGLDFAAGSFGRIALMMRGVRDRTDLDISRIGFLAVPMTAPACAPGANDGACHRKANRFPP